MICPLCGQPLATGPSYGEGTRRFTPGNCDNGSCRVLSVVVEWTTGAGRREGKGHWAQPGSDQTSITEATRRT